MGANGGATKTRGLDVASARAKGGVDEEEAAQSSLFKFLAILVKVVDDGRSLYVRLGCSAAQ